jgi:hypothetical protein
VRICSRFNPFPHDFFLTGEGLLGTVRRLQWLSVYSQTRRQNCGTLEDKSYTARIFRLWRRRSGGGSGLYCGPSPSRLRHPSPLWKYRGILCEWAMWAGTAKRNRLQPGRIQGLGISVTVDCILSECSDRRTAWEQSLHEALQCPHLFACPGFFGTCPGFREVRLGQGASSVR